MKLSAFFSVVLKENTPSSQVAEAQCLLLSRVDAPPRGPRSTPHLRLDNATIATLHAQAAGVHNIRSLVSVLQDPTSAHYAHWRDQVLLTLQRYVIDDVLGP